MKLTIHHAKSTQRALIPGMPGGSDRNDIIDLENSRQREQDKGTEVKKNLE